MQIATESKRRTKTQFCIQLSEESEIEFQFRASIFGWMRIGSAQNSRNWLFRVLLTKVAKLRLFCWLLCWLFWRPFARVSVAARCFGEGSFASLQIKLDSCGANAKRQLNTREAASADLLLALASLEAKPESDAPKPLAKASNATHELNSLCVVETGNCFRVNENRCNCFAVAFCFCTFATAVAVSNAAFDGRS